MTLLFKVLSVVFLVAACVADPVPAAEASEGAEEKRCPACEVEFCPKSAKECTHGLVRDECGCCKEGVCLLYEKEKCLNLKLYGNITETEMKKLSVCGEFMKCILRTDVKAGEKPESICVCEEMNVSCGKDNSTYQSMCQLREAQTELNHPGACKSAPEIISELEALSALHHESFSLNCEAKGFPVPHIHWEFEGLDGHFKLLPGDDPAIAVHVRGGPELFTVSSWIMIESLRPGDAGTYICVAKNSEGVTRSVASVNVQKKNS